MQLLGLVSLLSLAAQARPLFVLILSRKPSLETVTAWSAWSALARESSVGSDDVKFLLHSSEGNSGADLPDWVQLVPKPATCEWSKLLACELRLFEFALEQAANERAWFMLVSSDSVPLKPLVDFQEYLSSLNKSVFHVLVNDQKAKEYKHSQWVLLRSEDARAILRFRKALLAKETGIFSLSHSSQSLEKFGGEISVRSHSQAASDELLPLTALVDARHAASLDEVARNEEVLIDFWHEPPGITCLRDPVKSPADTNSSSLQAQTKEGTSAALPASEPEYYPPHMPCIVKDISKEALKKLIARPNTFFIRKVTPDAKCEKKHDLLSLLAASYTNPQEF